MEPSLYIVSVDAYAFEKSLKPQAPGSKYPRAIIVLKNGTYAGTLPKCYPFDPPQSLDVKFKDWAGDLPKTIDLYLEDPAVGGNRNLPELKWNPQSRTYAEYPYKN